MKESVFLGIDCGATTSKVGAVNESGEPVATELYQAETRSAAGAESILVGWMEAVESFFGVTGLCWKSVAGVGLAIPGPYLDYGVLGRMPNLPASLEGWRFLDDLRNALAERAGRPVPVDTANDGQLAGLPEARIVQKDVPGSVLMLAPGSGLGCSFIHADGGVFGGDHQAAVIVSHMPAPYESLGLPRFPCGCGREWGCFEAYTSISGLPHFLDLLLPKYPGHELASSSLPSKAKALTLRTRAQKGDPLAIEIFDLQARALGQAVAVGCMAYDPTHIVIGGGLMDRGATTAEFRRDFLETVRESAASTGWIDLRSLYFHQAELGDLSQAIGAALMARARFL